MLTRSSLSLAVLLACWGFHDARAESEPGAHTEHHHPIHAAAFVGVVTSSHGTGPAAGIDLERRFGPIGMALVVDTARVSGATVLSVIPAVVMHPWRGAKLMGGTGWERSHGHDELVLRAAAGYDLHVGALSFGPTMAVDRVGETTAVVMGATVGAGF
jgi:hypothetical protein